jgi:hypothetical protein
MDGLVILGMFVLAFVVMDVLAILFGVDTGFEDGRPAAGDLTI